MVYDGREILYGILGTQVGSGKTALVTLLHEGGHAAHFANIDQGSPFFGQERAPFIVATAENQSMFF
eukprot:gene6885-30860_t